ncbi:MAG: hypothetical protein PW792_16650 [Acidobacteriaceae bacterium]|nr:hypothetical protein [Acidobacteriaceae bacterium]
MQVLCKASETASDVRCEVCGQGFHVYWTRTSAPERDRRRAEILESLRQQHATGAAEAHPQTGFHLPEWNGDPRFSAAALLGNAPAWATA